LGHSETAAQNSELSVIYRPIETLIPYVRNARTHTDGQIAQIAASIREFGFTNPILLDGNNGVIAGHGRLLAARKLEIESVPCIDLCHLSEAQKRAYVIADNKLALNAGWDFELLAVEIDDLRDAEFDISVLGFEQNELNDLIGTPNDPSVKNPKLEDGFYVLVTCQDEHEQQKIFEEMQERGHNCKLMN
jgi:ParB-like chromosome segregation protein Spo0J